MEVFLELIGRIHPLVVHLPIGFLLMGIMLLFFSRKNALYLPLLRFSFFWGGISALVAVITGIVQYNQEGLIWTEIQGHFFAGLLTSAIAIALYFQLKMKKQTWSPAIKILSIALIAALFITGHLGGNITHGEDYLIAPLKNEFKNNKNIASSSNNIVLTPENYGQKILYQDIIQPLFDAKCISCHNPKKKKGGLILSDYKSILAGGKNGSVINKIENNAPIVERIFLPESEKKHMPPKAKVQLTKQEKEMIKLWIELGASDSQTLSDLAIDVDLLRSFFPKDETGIYPDTELPPLTQEVIAPLIERRFIVAPIFEGSSLLSVSSVNFPEFTDADMRLLTPLKDHLVALDLGKTAVTDSLFNLLSPFQLLTTLKLDRTTITGQGISQIKSLPNLKQLNLSNSSLNAEFIQPLFSFPAIEQVYLFRLDQQKIDRSFIPDSLQSIFITGHFDIAIKPRDTLVY